ncbi:hypothetical protein QR680_011372 [Steinernema hermaphroditum]|uniref:Uncharacterized protein n=1 Tax=Steinernema hermaphroditum TaxID=289476 RepID=A0AA39ITJ0_9BILA|nr:hypothetical protein QR680_011372 [Steinernema hermaphroditum]
MVASLLTESTPVDHLATATQVDIGEKDLLKSTESDLLNEFDLTTCTEDSSGCAGSNGNQTHIEQEVEEKVSESYNPHDTSCEERLVSPLRGNVVVDQEETISTNAEEGELTNNSTDTSSDVDEQSSQMIKAENSEDAISTASSEAPTINHTDDDENEEDAPGPDSEIGMLKNEDIEKDRTMQPDFEMSTCCTQRSTPEDVTEKEVETKNRLLLSVLTNIGSLGIGLEQEESGCSRFRRIKDIRRDIMDEILGEEIQSDEDDSVMPWEAEHRRFWQGNGDLPDQGESWPTYIMLAYALAGICYIVTTLSGR